MATEVVVNLKVNGLNETNQSLQQLETNIENIQQTTNNVGGTGFNTLSNNVKASTEKIDEFEKKLKKSVDVGKSAVGVTKTLAGSVNLATSAFAAFGVENEEVQKSLLKVQAAASFATGIKDLTEGFKALNVSGLALNKTLLANPFVLIGTLVVTLITSFIGFDEIIKILTKSVELAFLPFTALFGLFSSGKNDIDETTKSLEDYNTELEKSEKISNQNVQSKERELELLKTQRASLQQIRQAEFELAKEQKIAAGEREIDLTNRIAKLQEQLTNETLSSESQKKIQEELIQREKDLDSAKNQAFNAETRRLVILEQIRQDGIDAAKKRAQEELQLIIDTEKVRVLRTSEGSAIRIEAQINEAEKIFETRKKLQRQLEITDSGLLVLEQEKINLVQSLRNQLSLLSNSYKEVKQSAEEVAVIVPDFDVITPLVEGIVKRRELLVDEINFELDNNKLRLEDRLMLNDELFNAQIQLVEAQENLEIRKAEQTGDNIEEIQKKYDRLRIDAERKKSDEIEKIEKERLQQILNLTERFVQDIGSIVQEVSPFFESVGQTALQTFEGIANQVPDLLKKLTDDTLSEQERLAAGISFIGSSIGQITEIIQKDTEVRLEQIDKEEQERISSLERQKEAGLITEQELSVGKTQIQNEFLKKRREAEKKAFEQEKAIRIVQAIAQTAAAVLNSFSSGSAIGGPPVGAVFAGIAAAFGAAQIAIISSQKFPEQGGGGGTSSVPSTPTPSLSAQGSITPTTFNPQTFGTGVGQEQTFGNSNIVGETTSGVGGGGSQGGGLVLRAYVVESDIASTTNRLSSIREASEL